MKIKSLLLGTMISLSSHAADLSESYPVTSTTYLSDGTPVDMPFHVQGEAPVLLLG